MYALRWSSRFPLWEVRVQIIFVTYGDKMKVKILIASFLALTNFAACGGDSGKATNATSPKEAKAAKAEKKSPKAAKAAKSGKKKK